MAKKMKKMAGHKMAGNDMAGGAGVMRKSTGRTNGMMDAWSERYHAGVPTDVVIKNWPAASYDAGSHMEDTIAGIDNQMGHDTRKLRKIMLGYNDTGSVE